MKVYPFKTVEAGATVNSSIVWESMGRPVAVRPGRASRVWPTSTSARSWPSACRWPGPRPSRRGRRSPPRGTPAGPPGCSSGPSWWAATPPGINVDDLEAATVPVTRFQVTSSVEHGRGHRAPGSRRSPVGRAPLLRQGGHRRRRGHPAQDRAALPPRGLPPGPGPGDRRHRLPAPVPRALHRRPDRLGRPVQRRVRPSSSWCSTTRSAPPAS